MHRWTSPKSRTENAHTLPSAGLSRSAARTGHDRAAVLLLALGALGLGACAGGANYIYGTKVVDTEENRKLLDVVEQYRAAVEKRDASALLAMASPNYWEDGGTPTGSDDYGYDGLRAVLDTRFSRADSIRYTMRYMGVQRLAPNRVAVDVLIDASYAIGTGHGPQRLDMRDQNQLVLEYDGRRWLFVSGM